MIFLWVKKDYCVENKVFVFVFSVLVMKVRALCLLDKYPTTELHLQFRMSVGTEKYKTGEPTQMLAGEAESMGQSG
jgi:hypothetical protein